MYLVKKITFCLWSDKELHFVDTKCKFVIWDVEKGENWKNVEEKKKCISYQGNCSYLYSEVQLLIIIHI